LVGDQVSPQRIHQAKEPLMAKRTAVNPKALLDKLSKIYLALPEITRDDTGDHSNFKVRKKPFVYFLNNHAQDLGQGRQVGFARVITDFLRFAQLMDVFVLKEFRGRGYSKLLVKHILGHPDLSTVVRFTLHTADAHGLYRQFGFGTPNTERAMELTRPRGAIPS
jgi:GNAT superfamily N-acetyltransferase